MDVASAASKKGNRFSHSFIGWRPCGGFWAKGRGEEASRTGLEERNGPTWDPRLRMAEIVKDGLEDAVDSVGGSSAKPGRKAQAF